MPNPYDGRLRKSCFVGHQPSAPVCAVGRHGFQCLGDHGLHSLVRDRTRSAWSGFIQQAFESIYAESFAPLANRCSGNLQSLGDSAITQAFVTSEHNPGSHGHGLSRLRAPSQHREFFPLFRGHVERPGGASDTHTSSMRVSRLLFNVFLTQNTSEYLTMVDNEAHLNGYWW